MARRTSNARKNGAYSDKQLRRMGKTGSRQRYILPKEEKQYLFVHGFMEYLCLKCGEIRRMYLENGVADKGENVRRSQPCPSRVKCLKCGGDAVDFTGYMSCGVPQPAFDGFSVFAYDASGEHMACGIPGVMKSGKHVADYTASLCKRTKGARKNERKTNKRERNLFQSLHGLLP